MRGGTIGQLCIRFCKKEPRINTPLMEEKCPEVIDTVRFAPIGLDMPYRIIVQNNPVNNVDPLGLFGFGNTVSCYHADTCMKEISPKERCRCHCAPYSDPDNSPCLDACMKCFSSKNPLTSNELCKCGCEASGEKNCDQACKRVK
jgi:hypothetical protein